MNTFRFQLDPLIRKQQWDVEAIKRDFAQAQATVTQRTEACQRVVKEVEQLEDDIRAVTQAFSLDRYQSLLSYLKITRTVLAEKTAELNNATDTLSRIRAQLLQEQQTLASLEKRRERKKRVHDTEVMRLEQKSQDDSWVLRGGRDK